MVVLGVTPGLQACAYSVVAFRTSKLVGDPIDSDVLHGAEKPESASEYEVARAARVHQMIMGVVVNRDPPAALAIGPAYDPKESRRNVEAVRATLEALVLTMSESIRLVNFLTEEELRDGLAPAYEAPVGERILRKAVRGMLRSPLPSPNRRIVVATAAAIAAAHLIRTETSIIR